MKRFAIALALLLFTASIACAASSIIEFAELLQTPKGGMYPIQDLAPNPSLTTIIADNYSHTITLSTLNTYGGMPVAYIGLTFGGSGAGCIVRFMGSTIKSAWSAYPVSSSIGRAVHPNTTFFNYSGCYN